MQAVFLGRALPPGYRRAPGFVSAAGPPPQRDRSDVVVRGPEGVLHVVAEAVDQARAGLHHPLQLGSLPLRVLEEVDLAEGEPGQVAEGERALQLVVAGGEPTSELAHAVRRAGGTVAPTSHVRPRPCRAGMIGV